MIKTLVLISFFMNLSLVAQTVWGGAKTTFIKANNVDVTLEVNQDRLTDDVWLTRGNTGGGIYNIKSESSFNASSSPENVEWAYGNTTDVNALTFGSMKQVNVVRSGSNKNSPLKNTDMVLHLKTEDIYLDIKFLSWTSGNSNGGGFSYERSTDPNLSVPNITKDKIKIKYINDNTILIEGVDNIHYTIYNVLGMELLKGTKSSETIDISNLKEGVYLIGIKGVKVMKFIKK